MSTIIKIKFVDFRTGEFKSELGMQLHESSPLAELQDNELLDAIFEQSNLYYGEMFDMIQTAHQEIYDRPARSISVGDLIEIDGRGYLVADLGFKVLSTR